MPSAFRILPCLSAAVNWCKLRELLLKQLPSNSFLRRNEHMIQKPRNLGTTPILKKKALRVTRPFSEQLSEFQGILGAILGMALTT